MTILKYAIAVIIGAALMYVGMKLYVKYKWSNVKPTAITITSKTGNLPLKITK
jgi:hypothetical protein